MIEQTLAGNLIWQESVVMNTLNLNLTAIYICPVLIVIRGPPVSSQPL